MSPAGATARAPRSRSWARWGTHERYGSQPPAASAGGLAHPRRRLARLPMSARHTRRGPLGLGLGLLLVAAQAVTVAVPPVSAADPTPAPPSSGTSDTPPPRLFGQSGGTVSNRPAAPGPAAPVPTAGFDDTVVMSGLKSADLDPLRVRRERVRRGEERAHQEVLEPDRHVARRRGRPAERGAQLLGSGPAGVHPRSELPGVAIRLCPVRLRRPDRGQRPDIWGRLSDTTWPDDGRLFRQRTAVAPDHLGRELDRAGPHQRLVPAVPEPLGR